MKSEIRHMNSTRISIVGAILSFLLIALATPTQSFAQEALEDMVERQLEIRERLGELGAIEVLTPKQEAEMERLVAEYDALEQKIEAARRDGIKAKPTPKPRATPRARPTPKPRSTVPAVDQSKTKAKPSPTPKPRRTTPAKRDRSKPRAGRGNKPKTAPTPTGREIELSAELNELAENLLKDYRDRSYEFAIEGGTYAELIEAFGRMSGLEVVGNAPEGAVSFTSKGKMDFKSALGRIQMLLFEHPQQYWILLREADTDPHLEIKRVNEINRILEDHQIFATVKEYRARQLDDNDLALLQFTPEKGSIAEIEFLRDFMPDYVRISQKGDENALLIFGLVRDINKYLDLVKKFEGTIEDPRQIEIITIQHIAPSAAIELLKQLMDGFGKVTGAPAKVRRAGQVSVAEAWAEKVTAIPFDEQGTLLVKAMPNKIEEIKRLLPYVDIAPEAGEPVIVNVEHGNASDIITIVRSVLTADAAAPARPRSNRSRTKSTVPAGATATAANDLTMIDWDATNSIILLGPDDEVEEAKALIKRFDVPDGKDIVQVTLKHSDADQLAQRVTQIAQVMRPGSAARLSCTASPDGEVIVLAGPVAEIEAAKIIIDRLDVEPTAPPESVHVYKLDHVLPSQLVSILSAWDAAEEGSPTTKGARRRSSRKTANTAKFHADDQRGVLYIVCSHEEWTDRYEPILAQLDQELDAPDFKLIRIEHIEPDDAILQINALFAGGKPGRGANPAGPKCVAVPEGVMVLDATEAQLASISKLVEQIDVDLIASGKRIKRTFELVHSDPLDVIERLQMLIGAPKPGPKGAAAQGGDDVLFIDHQDSVIVWAPARRMDEIADLVAQLDTPLDENVMRSYSFGPGVDVVNLADMLTRFFAESTSVAAATPPQPGKAGARRIKAARAAKSGAGAELVFMPQPESRRIVVSAPQEMFEEIEKTIEMLRPDGPNADVAVDVQFFDVTNGDPDAIAQTVKQILTVKLAQMIATNEFVVADGGKVPTIEVSADAASKRIVAAAPAILMPDVAKLIERFDGGDYGKRVTRRVQLAKANAEDVVEVIKVMLGSAPASPSPARLKLKLGKGQPKAPVSATGESISVVAALSGDAVILIGFENELDEVEGWVRELDESTPDEFEIKVFRELEVDVETLADEIITILDKPAAGGKAPPKSEEDDMFGFDDIWDFGGPRCGTEICLTTNPFSNVLVVRTTPDKMREVEKWIELYKPKEGQEPITVATDQRPNEIVELKHADAYDASYELENIIDVIWTSNKPDVEKIPFENMLLIRAKTKEDIEKVKGYIAKYIDKVDKTKDGRIYRTTAVKGQPADLVAKILLTRLGGMDVDIEGVDGEGGKSLLVRLEPNKCVLPSGVAIRAAELTAAAAMLQAKVDEQADEENENAEPANEPATDSADETLLNLLGQAKTDSQAGEDETAQEAQEQKLKIKVDWRTNSIVVSGGSPSEVEEVEDTIEDIMRELEDVETAPDIRVYQLEYLDPNIAAQVLGAMFNVANQARGAGRMTPQQLAAQQKAMQQQMQQRLKQMQEQAKKAAGEKEGDKPKEGDEGGKTTPGGSSKQQSIRVFPYPALRALIVNAPTEMFPAIEELVATIDRKREVPPEYRFFPLEKQRASDVEQMLKIMLGLDEESQRTARGGKNTDPAVQAVAEMMKAQLNLPVTGPEGEIVSSSDSITITSNDNTNTVMAVAPISVLDLVGEIITELEAQEIPPIETRKYVLKFADATVVSPMLEELFAATGGARRGNRGQDAGVYNPSEVSQYVSFHADETNNAIFVRGIAKDFEKIEPVISEVDIKTAGDEVVSYELIHADAQNVAQSLGQVYETRTGGPRGGGSRVQFVGDRSSNTLFVRVPEEMRDEVRQKVELMDRLAASRPRVVPLQFGNPRSIADTLQRVYGAGRGGSDRIRISGDEATKQLLVVAPDELFDQIAETAKKMDAKEDLDLQVFKLKHARATEILESMQQLVRQALQSMSRTGGGSQMGPFSATADERTNSIAVMGGPLAFAMVAKVLADIDIPTDEAGGKTAHVVNLKYASAESVAWSLRELLMWGKPNNGNIDVSSPRGSNAVVVNATKQDFEQVKKIIEQLDVMPGDENRTARMITLKHAEVADMQAIIEDYLAKPGGSFRGRGGQDLMGGIKITAMESTNSLVVTGDDAGINRVATLVEKLDVEVEAGTAPKIIKLANAVASEIEPTITAMFEQTGGRRGNRRGGGRNQSGGITPVVVADDGANALIVRATPADYQIIEDLARDLDQQQGEAGTPFKLIQLASAFRAEDLAPTVEAAMRQASGSGSRSARGGRRNAARGGGTELSVEAITASNSLLLTGDPKDLELAEAVVATIQKNGPAGGKRTLIFRPDNISPDELKRVIDSMSNQDGSQNRRNPNRRPRRR